MNKKERAVREAVDTLKQWGLVDGSTVYAKVNKVSASGMHRRVSLYISTPNESARGKKILGACAINDISYHAARALEWGFKDGYAGGISVSGCGMDMLFHTVHSLSYVMGYGPLCQNPNQTEPEEKNGINGEKIKAIGLKYRQL